MLTGEDSNGIRVGEGGRKTQRESRDRQGIGDEIRRRGWFVEIDVLQIFGRASLECAIKAIRQKGQGHCSRTCGFTNVEFWQQPISLVGDVMALRDGNVKIRNSEFTYTRVVAADSEFFKEYCKL